MVFNSLPNHESDSYETTDAESALAFMIDYHEATLKDSADFANSPAALRTCIAELEFLPDGSSIAWSQGCVNWGEKPSRPGRSDTVIGQADKVYADRSALSVYISKPVGLHRPKDPNPLFNEPDLYIRFQATHPTTASRMQWVDYRIEREAEIVLRHVDKFFGATLQHATEMTLKLVNSDSDEDELLGMLGAALIEQELVDHDLDPAIDPDIETLRDANETYRELSDDSRNERANHLLAQQMGLGPERRVGPGEIYTLTRFLKSI